MKSMLARIFGKVMAAAIVAGLVVASAPWQVQAIVGGWAPSNFTDISSGLNHTCAAANGKAYCWGSNANGQLGTGTTTSSSLPVAVNTSGVLNNKTVTKIAAGATSTCAVADGRAYCWGAGANGRLGHGSTANSLLPVAVSTTGALGTQTVTDISLRSDHVCAVAGGRAYCWGAGSSGQLGNGATIDATSPVAVLATGVLNNRTLTDIAASNFHSCAVADGLAFCWGAGGTGRLGNNSVSDSSSPVAVTTASGSLSGGKVVTRITAGVDFSCAVASSRAHCWGSGANGRLGTGNVNNANIPAPVASAGPLGTKVVTEISSGNTHTCVVAAQSGYCWGMNNNGQLGNNNTTNATGPTTVLRSADVGPSRPFTAVAGGSAHTCAVAGDRMFCWGTDVTPHGFLGTNGAINATNRAVQVRSIATTASSPWRFYETGTSVAAPGAPLAIAGASANLTQAQATFRLRMGIKSASHSFDILSNSTTLNLQYAAKSTATCQAQTTGYANVTATTPIAYHVVSGWNHGTAISSSPNDPDVSAKLTPMTFVSQEGALTQSAYIEAGKSGIWDFSLKDNNSSPGTKFCLRLSGIDEYGTVAEVTSAVPGQVGVGFVTSAGAAAANTVFDLPARNMMMTCQTATGHLIDSSGARRLRLTQTGGLASWNVSVAPTAGATAQWNRVGGGASYDFNDSSGSPAGCNSGSDGDSVAGQLTVRPNTMTIAPQTGCGNGLTLGVASAFNSSIGAVTLLSGSASAATNCYRDIYGGEVSQTLPANQPSGTYRLDLTVTAVMQ